MSGIKEPIESYETDEDGNTFLVTEYGPEDEFLLAQGWEEPNYTQIPNQLLGHWDGNGGYILGQMTDMGEAELKVALALCRITFGFHKEAAPASLSWLEKATGLSRQGVLNGIEALIKRGLFIKDTYRDGRNLWRKVHGGSQRGRPEVVNVVDQTSQRGRPNKEILKKEVNKVPTPTESEREPPPVKADIGKLLRSTLTKGENEVERSQLAEYIGQQLNSPVPSGQCNKLAMGYTEQLPGGRKTKHPSPDELWLTSPKFPEWVDERIAYVKGRGGSPATQRAKAVNAICQYKGSQWAWLEWVKTHDSAPGFTLLE